MMENLMSQQVPPPQASSLFRQLKLLLFSPDRFFAGLSAGPVDLKIPILIVCGLFLVDTAGNYATISADFRSLEIGYPALHLILYINLCAILLSPFLTWVYYSVFFYGISYLYRGRGTFAGTLAPVGFGCVPLVLGGIILLFLLPLTSMPVQDYFIPAHQAAHAAITSLVHAAVTIFALLWSGYLWTAGMRHARDLSPGQAQVTVFVPVGLTILVEVLWLLWKLIGVYI